MRGPDRRGNDGEQVGQTATDEGRASSRQKLLAEPVEIIKEKIGDYHHHGTGNPLVVRSPDTPPDTAIRNLAKIIRNGQLGATSSVPSAGDASVDGSTNSIVTVSQFKTERGNIGSFWTNKVRLAGSYGWTGLILQPNVDTSMPLSVVEQAIWFLVENDDELSKLRALLLESNLLERWNAVKDRVVTVAQLAEKLKD